MPTEGDVMTVSPEAPIAQHLYGAKVGETISWTAPNGKEFQATITQIDQSAVRLLHEKMVESRNE